MKSASLALLLSQALLPAEAGAPGNCAAGCPGEICCMHCGTGNGTAGPFFDCMEPAACVTLGGQEKPWRTVAYSRPPPSRPAKLLTAPQDGPEQVHLIGGKPHEVTVVYLTRRPAVSAVELRRAGEDSHEERKGGWPRSYSFFNMPSGWPGYDPGLPEPGTNLSECHQEEAYTFSQCIYTSKAIHTVKLERLTADTVYEYRPAGSDRWRKFRTPPAVGQPITFGVTADVGQTEDSHRTLKHLKSMSDAGQLDALLLPGDLAYADGFGPAWDSWGRLSEPLLESLPTAYGVGNHEYASGNENFAHWLPRYGWPSAQQSGSTSPQWYSFEAGLAHVIMMCSYCDYSPESLQRAWLEHDLKTVDRARTPWLIALWHTPWYVSAEFHTMTEGAAMRSSMEHLLYEHKVDLVLSGHLHAYERTEPVYKSSLRCDGPVYITIGDGGNHEGPACPWAKAQPDWSAIREFSFGHGILQLANSSHAHWSWHRNQDGKHVFADGLWMKRAALRCERGLVV